MMRYVLILMGLFCWMGSALAETETDTLDLTADLKTSTFTQVSTEEAVHDVRLSRHTLTFKLDDPIWHHTYNNSPIDFVGSKVTIESITLPDLATNTANLTHVDTVTLLDANGKEIAIATLNEEPTLDSQIQLPSVNGTHVAAIPYVYTFSTALTLDTSKTYTLRLNPNSNLTTPPLLPVFRNASSQYTDDTDPDRSFVRIDGGDAHYSPYLSFDGQMTMKRFRYDLTTAGEHSLAGLLASEFKDADDTSDTMVVVRLMASDAILKMDRSLTTAALVVASNTPATEWTQPTAEGATEWQPVKRAGTVRFLDGYTFTGPIDFRDVKDSTGDIKMIRLEYTDANGNPKVTTSNDKTETVAVPIPRSVWNPSNFALHCDLEFSAYPDMSAETEDQPAWFGRNTITIPSGRSVRIVTHVAEGNRPNLAFADATSRLALAIPSSEPHVLSHYRALIEQNSGILRMVSPFKIPSTLVLGTDDTSATAPLVQTLQSYDATTFEGSLILGYGVNNNAQYVQKSGAVTIGGDGLILGQGDAATAKYVVQDGTFNGKVTFGEQVHDAALIVGDGVGEANTAIAELSALLSKPANSTTNITGTAEVIVERDGQLVLNGDLDMTPALRRRMTMNGGTLKAMGATPTYTFGTDFVNGGGLSINGNVTIDASGATSSGTNATQLTIDAIKGMTKGTLTFAGKVNVGTIGDFRGTLDAANGASVTINSLYGINSDICFHYLGEGGTTGVANILDLARRSNYRGTLSFDATDYPTVDVSATTEITLISRLSIQNGQTLRIRLDQFADATILWPDTIDTDHPPRLEIIESGAYGGELTISHLPDVVKDNMCFYYFVSGGNITQHVDGTWKIEPQENGVYDTFTWEYPHFTEHSAWIDAEFNGNGNNTGWLYFDAKKEGASRGNVLLKGYEILTSGKNDWGELLDKADYYTETSNPKGQGIKMRYRPYIAPEVLTYPDVWSAAIRLTAPNASSTAILAIGSSISNTDALVLATGDTAQELVLWHLPRNDVNAMVAVTRATIADIVNVPHVFSAVCDGTKLTIYIDGGFLTEYTLPPTWQGLKRGGLQVGQVLDDSSNAQGITERLKGSPQDNTGSVDYIRFYKGALTAQAMEVLADETPPVKRNVRYVRDVTTDGYWEDIINNPWFKETWNKETKQWVRSTTGEARPEEGAEIQLYVQGSKTLQVNTSRRADIGFLSKDWLYSMINVYPIAGSTATPELKFVPIFEATNESLESNESLDSFDWTESLWYTETEGTTYKYGRLRFTGGCGQAVHDTEACVDYDNPTGALGVHGFRSDAVGGSSGTLVSTTTTQSDIETGKSVGASWYDVTWTQTIIVTQTEVWSRNKQGGAVAAHFTPSAGVVKFSRSAPIFIGAVYSTGPTGSYEEQQTRTRQKLLTRSIASWFEPTASAWNALGWTEGEWSAWQEGSWGPAQDNQSTATVIDETTQESTLVKAKLELHADVSLIRGYEDEEYRLLHLTGPVQGLGDLIPNPEANFNTQVSQWVWVPKFEEGTNWLLTDATETAYGENSNPRGTVDGLLAIVQQIPGRLYLDLSSETSTGNFSKAAWYRYGYNGANTLGVSAEKAKANEQDIATAIAFQIRVNGSHTLTMDSARTGVATLHVEPATNAEAPVLKLTGDATNNLHLSKQLITFVRLEDIGENPALTFGENVLIHGHTTGTYAFKDRTWDRALLRDSIATLEAHGTQNFFQQNFELRNTNLVIANGAILEQQGEANHLWAKSLTMGEGATFRFHAAGEDSEANGVVFSENMKMTGTTATLHGYGQVDDPDAGAGQLNLHRCNFTAAGIEGPTDKAAVLTLNSASNNDDKKERWICYTANLVDHSATGGKLGLTKIGTGIMAFRSPTPPSVTGPVRVEEGILRVGTKSFSDDALNAEQHLDAAIGHNGLHVAADASLEPNHYANPEDVIACIPKDQTLSGTGTIGGVLRLNSGAQLENCAGMTIRKMVVDGSTLPDIKVTLPKNITEQNNILFHMLNDSARAEVRRRFYATKDGVRWDVCVNHKEGIDGRPCQSHYVVYAPGVPVPKEPTTASGNAFNTDNTFTNTMTRYYQGYSVSRLRSSTGYTKYLDAASNYKLNASEIENAFRCFSNIWTFDRNEAPNTATSAYLDDEQSLLMAYEFGISRMAIRDLPTTGDTPTRYLIVEVQVINTLQDVFGNVVGAGNVADFQLGSTLTFTCQLSNSDTNAASDIKDAVEITDFDATDLTEPTESSHTAGVRVFAIPFSEARFPLGTSSLKVKAVMPETNNDSATTASY